LSTALAKVGGGELLPSQNYGASRHEAFMPVMAIKHAVERYNALLTFTQEIMKADKDYGKVPGTDKPTLLKPGAEKLCSFFGLTPKFLVVKEAESWGEDGEAFFYYWYKCQLYRGDLLIGEGEGSCNSHESKYRYRWVPEANVPTHLSISKLKSRGGRRTLFEPNFALDKRETGGKYGKPEEHWAAFDAAIKAGTARRAQKDAKSGKPMQGWEIEVDEKQYQVPNPDVADQVNTIQKMAQKRAMVAATLIACNASEYYTQDVEDMDTIDVPYQKVEQAETLEEVKNRRIAEEQEKLDRQRREQSKQSHEERPPEPSQLDRALATLNSIKSICDRFAAIKGELAKVADETVYYGILRNHGVEHSNQFKSSKPAKECYRELYAALEEMRAKAAEEPPPAPEPSVITDSDLPDALWPEGRE
jgi:hypothetical protein